MKILAIILIVLGALGLAYGGFGVVYPHKVVDAGPVQISVDKKKEVTVPPLLGVVALASGVVILIVDRKKT
jgi:hypothetical protein